MGFSLLFLLWCGGGAWSLDRRVTGRAPPAGGDAANRW
jgi:uncharacterized membrane protein YphA (DoxX/SURF4 family)